MNDTTQTACEVIAKVRSRRPLVHHITNFVVMNATANITLCMGALPVMAHAIEEVAEMVAASALVLNLGTLWPEQVEAMVLAGRRANQWEFPLFWILWKPAPHSCEREAPIACSMNYPSRSCAAMWRRSRLWLAWTPESEASNRSTRPEMQPQWLQNLPNSLAVQRP